MQGYVYLINIQNTDFFKIGKTKDNDIKNRLAQLQTANPMKLEVSAVYKHEDYTYAEAFIHAQLASNRLRGEWFEVEHDEMIKLFDSYNLMLEASEKIFPGSLTDYNSFNLFDYKVDSIDDVIVILLRLGKSPRFIRDIVRGNTNTIHAKIKEIQARLGI